MRRTFAKELYKLMETNDRVVLITADLGYGMWDNIQAAFPDRFINIGAAEQTMIGIAIGLSYEGWIPFCYSITNFVLYRPFEMLRTYVNHENINIKLVASGRDKDYQHDGISHWSEDAKDVLKALPNIAALFPRTTDEVTEYINTMDKVKGPQFISLKR